mmetsp:Transcript_16757/g.65459  ORF Transcript_16757/g.65459 Transcript_16757/m.65459 type:complete len:550 (-) Transcript_16757:77-1726(-)
MSWSSASKVRPAAASTVSTFPAENCSSSPTLTTMSAASKVALAMLLTSNSIAEPSKLNAPVAKNLASLVSTSVVPSTLKVAAPPRAARVMSFGPKPESISKLPAVIEISSGAAEPAAKVVVPADSKIVSSLVPEKSPPMFMVKLPLFCSLWSICSKRKSSVDTVTSPSVAKTVPPCEVLWMESAVSSITSLPTAERLTPSSPAMVKFFVEDVRVMSLTEEKFTSELTDETSRVSPAVTETLSWALTSTLLDASKPMSPEPKVAKSASVKALNSTAPLLLNSKMLSELPWLAMEIEPVAVVVRSPAAVKTAAEAASMRMKLFVDVTSISPEAERATSSSERSSTMEPAVKVWLPVVSMVAPFWLRMSTRLPSRLRPWAAAKEVPPMSEAKATPFSKAMVPSPATRERPWAAARVRSFSVALKRIAPFPVPTFTSPPEKTRAPPEVTEPALPLPVKVPASTSRWLPAMETVPADLTVELPPSLCPVKSISWAALIVTVPVVLSMGPSDSMKNPSLCPDWSVPTAAPETVTECEEIPSKKVASSRTGVRKSV